MFHIVLDRNYDPNTNSTFEVNCSNCIRALKRRSQQQQQSNDDGVTAITTMPNDMDTDTTNEIMGPHSETKMAFVNRMAIIILPLMMFTFNLLYIIFSI